MSIHPYREAWSAVKKNFLPGLALQVFIAGILLAYLLHEPARHGLESLALWKKQGGYASSFFVLGITAGLLPEIFRVLFFQKGKFQRIDFLNITFGFFYWGFFGVLLDGFYHLQGFVVGYGTDWKTVFGKMAVDIFLFIPFVSIPLAAILYRWRDREFHFSAFAEVGRKDFLRNSILPLIITCWAIWIPVILVIYSLPMALQMAIAILAESFWALLLITLTEIQARRDRV